jgi:hypothetical protein
MDNNGQEEKRYKFTRSELQDIIWNASSRSAEWINKLIDPRRNIDSECGYPAGDVDVSSYRQYFDNHCLATRVVEVLPKECWQVKPEVYEDEDPDVKTPFEEDWDEMVKGLNGKSWSKDEECNPVWEAMERADILSGIGHFGVMLLGFDDGEPLDRPVPMLKEYIEAFSRPKGSGTTFGSEGSVGIAPEYQGGYGVTQLATDLPVLKPGTKRKLLYMRPFDESLVQITQLESDIHNPRFGQPIKYRITLNEPDANSQQSLVGLTMANPDVHWTRVIHIPSDGAASTSMLFGPPRQKAVWRQLLNTYKIYGSSAEAYWQGCINKMTYETHPQLGGDVEVDTDDLKDQTEKMRHSMQHDIFLMGMTAKSIAPTVTDPTAHLLVQIQAICIKIACPQRVFMGTERGELASSQDDSSWNDKVRSRQKGRVTPVIINPTVDRLIATGVLREPKWVKEQSEEQKPTNEPVEAKDTEAPTIDPEQLATNRLLRQGLITLNASIIPQEKGKGIEDKEESGSKAKNTDGKASSTASKDFASSSPYDPTPKPKAPPKPIPDEREEKPGYSVSWPDLDSESTSQKAAVALQITQALAAYVAGNLEAVIELKDYLTIVLDWTDERAEAVISSRLKAIMDEERLTPDPMQAQQQEMGMEQQKMEQDHELRKMEIEKMPAGMPPMGGGAGKPPRPGQSPIPTANFNPSQPRNSDGEWSSGGGGKGKASKSKVAAGGQFEKDLKMSDDELQQLETKLIENRNEEWDTSGVDRLEYLDQSEHVWPVVEGYTTGMTDTAINEHLRSGGTIGNFDPKSVTNIDAHSLEALKNLDVFDAVANQKLTQPVTVYRGIQGSVAESLFSNMKDGDMYQAKGFMSTTVNPKRALEYGTSVMEIKAKRGVYVGDHGSGEEKELIKAHDSKFIFKGIRESGSGKTKRTIISLEEV